MKILLAADMEGVTGVVNWEHVDSKHSEYARFRELMTADVNAAIRGAFEAGAEEVIVSDGHGNGRNILLEKLDPRVRLNAGSPSPLAMVQGAGSGMDAAMFVGYHARAGAERAILAHTWSGRVVNLWLNGILVGEIGLNAALCGHFGMPVIMISGDQTACSEAVELLGPLETAVVKQANGRMAAECLSLEVAQQYIREAAERAVERHQAGAGPQPWRVQPPVTVTVQFSEVQVMERAAILPGARQLENGRVEFVAEDMITAYRAFRAMVGLGIG